MTPTPTAERAFEGRHRVRPPPMGPPDACPERGGLLHEPPAPPYGDGFAPGSYHRRTSDTHYDRDLCLIPRDVIDFPRSHPATHLEPPQAAPRRRCPQTLPQPPRPGTRPARRPGCLPQGHQGLRLQVRPRLLPPGERPQRGDPPSPRREPLLRHPPTPVQREDGAER